jgi:predicted ferric reductase
MLHAAVVGTIWWRVSHGLFLGGAPGGRAIALGRLAGLSASSALMLQLLLVSRLPWLERSLGCDRLFKAHRRLGLVLGLMFLLHPALIIGGYARRHHLSLGQQFIETLGDWPYVRLAGVALLLILAGVVLSIRVIRSRVAYETWHVSHLAMYVAFGFVAIHQLNGAELASRPWMARYWIALHGLAIGCVLIFRAGRPILGFLKHRFHVDKVVAESDDVFSVYLTGHRLDRFTFSPGQYANIAFLAKGLRAPHPFSFSAAPNGQYLRVSVKAVGDFTGQIRRLRPGTLAVLEGPLGAFTATRSSRNKYLLVAGGIGITPIRALIESLVGAERDIVLLYAAKTVQDLVFASELRSLSAHCHFVLSRSTDAVDEYERGRIDRVMIMRLVPDVQDREVFVCGPPPMMQTVIAALRAMKIHGSQVHCEQFV